MDYVNTSNYKYETRNRPQSAFPDFKLQVTQFSLQLELTNEEKMEKSYGLTRKLAYGHTTSS